MKGKGNPVTGSNPITIPIFTMRWMKIMDEKPIIVKLL